jgi:hypothetical protein
MKTVIVMFGSAVPDMTSDWSEVTKSADDEPVSYEIAVTAGGGGALSSNDRSSKDNLSMSLARISALPMSSAMRRRPSGSRLSV